MQITKVKSWAAIAIAALIVSPEVFARPLDEVTASKTLTVVTYDDNAPFSWDDNGKIKGIDADIGRAVARELGVEATIMLRPLGEKVDDDLRANIWKGPLTGGGIGDLMMHVPVDRDLAARNNEVVIGNPYFQERVVVAIHPEMTGDKPTFEIFKKQKIGVQLATVADYFLMTYQDGALIDNIAHHVKPEAGAKEFASKEVAAMMGTSSTIEALLHDLGIKPVIVRPDMDGIVRKDWVVGMAWRENSRDLGYSAQAALEKIKASGELAKIFAAYGVTYVEPPIDDK